MFGYILTFIVTVVGVAAGNLLVPLLKKRFLGEWDAPAQRSGVFSMPSIPFSREPGEPCDFERVELPTGVNYTCNPILSCLGKQPDAKKSFESRLAELEHSRKTKIVFITHPFSGSYFSSGLTMADADELGAILRGIDKDQDVDLIIDTPGGSLLAAEVIVNMLCAHDGLVNVFIPRHAASAGTLIALAGDTIYLGNNAFMSPIDPQYSWFSAKSVVKYTDTPSARNSMFGDVMQFLRNDANAVIQRVVKVVGGMYSSDDAEHIRDSLILGPYQHDQPLFRGSLQIFVGSRLIKEDVPNEIYDIFEEYLKANPVQKSQFASILGI